MLRLWNVGCGRWNVGCEMWDVEGENVECGM